MLSNPFVFLLLSLLIIAAIAWLATWVLGQFPPPEPLHKIIYVAIIVISILAVIFAIAQAFGMGGSLLLFRG